ncbi:MAG: alanine--glyoxylate aminotransferase family protein [Desulfovibrio sp.]|jgi:alanine-glyoxylate transaminase/serine-glyoxylate transaminase/serine-pyruvate transaminase|nr:alanine--glyoxylate aminotransferase family protein [Desulfovibrio sp.]
MPEDLLQNIRPVLLMGPGPSPVCEAAYAALGKPTLGHLDPYFIRIMDAIKEHLRQIFHTKNEMTLTISGTGSSGIEACFVNLVEPGDRVLILANGVFGKRQQDMAVRLGARVDVLDVAWGEPLLPDAVKKKLAGSAYDVVSMVHAETSTGVRNPVEEISPLVKSTDSLFIVDCVTSLGCIPVDVDRWEADAACSCSQKGLSCPPGLAPITLSARAMAKVKGRKSRVSNFYMDMTALTTYWEGDSRAYHHTAPSNMYYALYAALREFLREGEDKVFSRHLDTHAMLVRELGEMGLTLSVAAPHRLPQVNVVGIPEGVDDEQVRSRLLNEYRIEIGAGLGALAGKVWRIGLMGHGARRENVEKLLDAMRRILGR